MLKPFDLKGFQHYLHIKNMYVCLLFQTAAFLFKECKTTHTSR